MTKAKKVTSIEELEIETQRLTAILAADKEVINQSFDKIKSEYLSANLLNKVAASMVPAVIRHSPILNDPINYIADKIGRQKGEEVVSASDNGKGNAIRNVLLALAEGAGAYILTKKVTSMGKRRPRLRED